MAAISFHEHTEYQASKELLKQIDDLLTGDHRTLVSDEYLWKHELEKVIAPSEGADDPTGSVAKSYSYATKGAQMLRETRQLRTRYINRTKPVLSRYVSMLLVNKIELKPVETLFTPEELRDVDGAGTSLTKWIKNAAEAMFRDGRALSLADSKNVKAKSKADEQALGLRPYLQLYKAEQIKDWDIEADNPGRIGKPNWIRIEYKALPKRDPQDAPTEGIFCKVLRVGEGGYQIERYQKVVGKQGLEWASLGVVVPEPPLPEIPAVMYRGESWLKDLIPIALLRHNTQSAYDNVLLFQAFQRIFAAGKMKPGDGIILQEGVVTVVPEGTDIKVVEPINPAAQERRLSTLDLELLQTAFYRDRFLPVDSRESPSAESEQEQDSDFIANLKAMLQCVEDFVNDSIRHWAEQKGETYTDAHKLSFNPDLVVENARHQIDTLVAVWDIATKYPTWIKAELKRIVQQRNLSDVDAILEEIEALTTAPKPEAAVSRTDIFKAALAKGKEEEPEDGEMPEEIAPGDDGK